MRGKLTVEDRGPVRIGIDFGGTKIEGAALDAAGNILLRKRLPTPAAYDAALTAVRDVVMDIEAQLGSGATVGIGTPGSLVAATGRMRNANVTYLNEQPFLHDLHEALGRDVRLANDANCFALSEAIDGAAAGSESVFGLIIGTGCGGGLVLGGKVLNGPHGLAGELGHVPLPDPQGEELPLPPCWCGQRGCLESWISGTGFQRSHTVATGRDMTAPEIVAAAGQGDGPARAALDGFRDRLARALALVANMVDPDVFVLGGGMSNVEAIYDGLAEAIRARSFSGAWAGSVVPARWGDSSGVRGAAFLWEIEEARAQARSLA
ncbi:ROK family protein [Novosphingobium sp. 9]|uniref:ROK family protein n=1 Tax=Novosphingobium sp. 9 TaxID=2025349 RepID=UPI0021B6DE72|nr:ROK family protein [Novosphingobium sp. 9]